MSGKRVGSNLNGNVNGKGTDGKKKEKRSDTIHLRMSKSDMEDLEMSAYLDDITKSEFVRKAIRMFLNLHNHAPEVLEELMKEIESDEREDQG